MKKKIVVLNSPSCFGNADATSKPECKGCTWLFDCIEKRELKKLEKGKEN